MRSTQQAMQSMLPEDLHSFQTAPQLQATHMTMQAWRFDHNQLCTQLATNNELPYTLINLDCLQ